jgi:hypothetical protein
VHNKMVTKLAASRLSVPRPGFSNTQPADAPGIVEEAKPSLSEPQKPSGRPVQPHAQPDLVLAVSMMRTNGGVSSMGRSSLSFTRKTSKHSPTSFSFVSVFFGFAWSNST